MSTLVEKYNAVFEKVFSMAEEPVENMSYFKTRGWDSMGHMILMTEIENVFDVELSDDDMMQFYSYGEGIRILKKYCSEM